MDGKNSSQWSQYFKKTTTTTDNRHNASLYCVCSVIQVQDSAVQFDSKQQCKHHVFRQKYPLQPYLQHMQEPHNRDTHLGVKLDCHVWRHLMFMLLLTLESLATTGFHLVESFPLYVDQKMSPKPPSTSWQVVNGWNFHFGRTAPLTWTEPFLFCFISTPRSDIFFPSHIWCLITIKAEFMHMVKRQLPHPVVDISLNLVSHSSFMRMDFNPTVIRLPASLPKIYMLLACALQERSLLFFVPTRVTMKDL